MEEIQIQAGNNNNKTATTHVVMLPSPGMGHVIPSLELAKCLVSSHALQVTLFVPTTTQQSSTSTKLLLSTDDHSLPRDLNIINLPPVVVDDTSNVVPTSDTDLPSQITAVIRESLPTIRSIIEGLPRHRRPTVLIADLFATDAFRLADDLKMTKYLFFTSNVTALALIATFPKLESEDRSIDSIRIPGYKSARVLDLGDSFMDRRSGGFKCLSNHAQRFAEVAGVFANSFEDLEPHILEALNDDDIRLQIPLPRVYPVGPIIKSSLADATKELNSECLTWLDSQPLDSVLLVSFGSGGTLSAEQVTELAWGLELSQQRFIWVVRKPVDMVVSSSYLAAGNGSSDDPSEYLPEGFLGRTQGRGLVVPNWAPQVEILSHVATGGFLSHSGWNSTLESIVHGVPMIPWPLFAEQHLNALMVCDDFGVGTRSPPIQSGGRVVRREAIERVVRMVMEGEDGKVLRARAKELKTSAGRALSKGGSSYKSLSRVTEKWKAES